MLCPPMLFVLVSTSDIMVITQVSTISQSVISYVHIFRAESTSKCSGYCQ
uniref:Uncharacterized protein n=1 Tax=Setaria viridis TaxID=4556 RepID=A0A4U6STB4_SETVI|nr:hypothetical protein SEVIR_9G142533v2 [Setaria viridis]